MDDNYTIHGHIRHLLRFPFVPKLSIAKQNEVINYVIISCQFKPPTIHFKLCKQRKHYLIGSYRKKEFIFLHLYFNLLGAVDLGEQDGFR